MNFRKQKNETNFEALRKCGFIHPLNVVLNYFGEDYSIVVNFRNVYDAERGKSAAADFTMSLEMECVLRDLYQSTMYFTLTTMIIDFINICEVKEVNILTSCTCQI